MLWDSIESELEDKIRRLEEDRNNVDVTSQVWAEQNLHRKRRRHRQVKKISLLLFAVGRDIDLFASAFHHR